MSGCLGRVSAGDAGVGSATLPFVSVIVPHYDDLDALGRCVSGLMRQSWPRDRYEVVIADNNSACGLAAVAACAAGCRIVHAREQGAGPARNAGVAASAGEMLGFIDSDCVPSADWIAEGVRALRAADFAGGHVETVPRDPAEVTAVEAWEIVFGFDFERYILREGYTGSGNMWVWRQVFDAVGGFRAGVAEDMDWSFRARAAGYQLVYQPAARVAHHARRDWSELRRRWRRVIREHYLLACERRYGRARWFVRTAAMPASIAPHLWRIAACDRLSGARVRVGAAAVLVLHRLWRTGVMMRVGLLSPRTA